VLLSKEANETLSQSTLELQ